MVTAARPTAVMAPKPAPKANVRTPSTGVSATAMYPLRSGGGNQAALQSRAQPVAPTPVAPQPAAPKAARLMPLAPEMREQMGADINYIVRILKGGKPDSGDQTRVIETIRTWARKDDEVPLAQRGGRRTPVLDHFLILLKIRVFTRSGIRSLWQDQYAIVYDTLWYDLRGYALEEFKRTVQRSETQRTEGAETAEAENGAALIAKQEAMGLWGMLKGMGTGLVSMAGPSAAQYISEQFDQTGNILFGQDWGSSEPLVAGMNAAQIGTAGGDVIMQLVMLARSLPSQLAKSGRVLQLINNLDKFKRAQQVLGALGGAQGVLMSLKGISGLISELIEAERKLGKKITADSLIHNSAFVDQIVMLVSSGVGIALAAKGAPPAGPQLVTRARIGALLGSLQVTAALNDLAEIAQTDASEAEKQLKYGVVFAGLIPQLVGLIISGHGYAQTRREAGPAPKQPGKKAPAAKRAPTEEPPDKPATPVLEPVFEPELDGPGKTMRDPADPATPARRPSNADVERARQPIAEAHQAAMLDEVKNRLAPRDAPPVPADVASGKRPARYAAPKRNSRTIGEPHATLAQARASYDHVIAEMGGSREVGIWQHPDAGEYIVRLGQPTSVGPPRGDTPWRPVQHFHTNTSDVPLWRMPASADVSELATHVRTAGRAMTEIVEYPLPGGKRGRAAYTVTPELKVTVEFTDAQGKPLPPKVFNSLEDFDAYHPSRKIFATQSMRDEVDQWLDDTRTSSPPVQAEAGAKTQSGAAKRKPADPADPTLTGLRPPTPERLVAVRVQGDSATKGQYIPGPLPPQGADAFTVDRAAFLKSASKPFKSALKDKAFAVMPESQARALGFVERGESFKRTGPRPPETDAASFTPLKKGSETLESRHAESRSHPIAARTSPKRTQAKNQAAWERTIAPSLEEAESYKFQLIQRGELGLKRAGNASERGADHITVDTRSSPPRIYLNDATTPGQTKKPKPQHKDWLAQFKRDFPAGAKGVRDFGFDSPEINAKINQALDAGEVYTRTLRPGEVRKVDGQPLREYVADEAVKVGHV